jgi:hypothetical protein
MDAGATTDPFARLLELYVLWSIEHLTAEQRDLLRQLEPKLQKTYGRTGTWQEILVGVMEFPSTMPETIRRYWEKNKRLAERNGERLAAEDFAQMFVATNFGEK